MKKVIVISTSLRVGSNSDMLADKFIEGAQAAGNEVEKLRLVARVSVLQRLSCLPEIGQVCNRRRCQRHYAEGARSRCGVLGNAHLLL